jgi:hypothetical protein
LAVVPEESFGERPSVAISPKLGDSLQRGDEEPDTRRAAAAYAGVSPRDKVRPAPRHILLLQAGNAVAITDAARCRTPRDTYIVTIQTQRVGAVQARDAKPDRTQIEAGTASTAAVSVAASLPSGRGEDIPASYRDIGQKPSSITPANGGAVGCTTRQSRPGEDPADRSL